MFDLMRVPYSAHRPDLRAILFFAASPTELPAEDRLYGFVGVRRTNLNDRIGVIFHPNATFIVALHFVDTHSSLITSSPDVNVGTHSPYCHMVPRCSPAAGVYA